MAPAGNHRLRRVMIFTEGTHRNKRYSKDDLDSMVFNFNRFSAEHPSRRVLLRVPGVIGHSEDQEYLQRSDLPAAAWCERLYREGPYLYADLAEVPAIIARLIKGKRYRKVSAEIYDEPPPGIPGSGKMLRRIAFLGADQPQVKGLDDIPMPEPYSEAGGWLPGLRLAEMMLTQSGAWACFSEVAPMDHDQMLEAIAAHGVNVQLLEGVPDPALQEILRCLESKDEQEGAEDEMDQEDGEEFQDWPEPGDEPAKAKYRERCKKYLEHAQKMSSLYGEGEDTAVQDILTPAPKKVLPDDDEEVPMKMSELKAIVSQAVTQALSTGGASVLGDLQKFAEETRTAEKTRAVDAIIEELNRAGKLTPAEKDGERQDLLALDRTVIHRFSEGGKTIQESMFDRRVRRLRARPSMFGERFRDPANSGTGAQGEKAKVEAHYETYSEQFAKYGTSKEDLVGAFESRRKQDPGLTAERFLSGKV